MSKLFDGSYRVSVPAPTNFLDLNERTHFEIVEWNAPLPRWRRKAIDGTYTAGRRLVSAVPDTATITAVVRVMGTDWENQQEWAQTLFNALSQFDYTITEIINTVARTFACEPADITPSEGGLEPFGVARGRQVYTLTIPCTEVTA